MSREIKWAIFEKTAQRIKGGGVKIEKITFFAETEWARLNHLALKDRSISDPPKIMGGGGSKKKAFPLK